MLTIKKEHNDGTVYFDELRSGDLFIFNNTVYLVLEEGCCCNTVCLTNGVGENFDNSDKVKKIDSATLTINV